MSMFTVYLAKSVVLLLPLLLSFSAAGMNKVVVIPLSGDDIKPLQNVISVAKSNGDFNNPATALDSIDDADENNPYLIVIAPGIYEISSSLVMKPYVDVAGSGKNVTQIRGAIQGASFSAGALVVGANNASISDLTLKNTGPGSGGLIRVGIYNNSVTTKLKHLKLMIDGAAILTGISNTNSVVAIDGVDVEVSGPGSPSPLHGIDNDTSIVNLTRSDIRVKDGASNQTGVAANLLSNLRISDSRVDVDDGTGAATQFGVRQQDSLSRIRIDGSNIRVASNNGSATIFSTIGSAIRLSDTDVRGSVSGGRCSFVFNQNGFELNSNCAATP